MNDNEKLIERLRAVIDTAKSDAYTAASQMNVTAEDHAETESDVNEAEAVCALVVAALEGAEKAHTLTDAPTQAVPALEVEGDAPSRATPTDDEREVARLRVALDQVWDVIQRDVRTLSNLDPVEIGAIIARALEPARRSVVPEPSAESEAERTCAICGRTDIVAEDMPFNDNGTAWEGGNGSVICTRCDPTKPRSPEPQGEPSDAQGVIARALMDSARMDTFNAWSLAEEIAAALRAAGVGGAR